MHNKRKRKNREKLQHFFATQRLSLSRVHPAEFVARLIYSLVLAIINPCDLTIGIRVVMSSVSHAESGVSYSNQRVVLWEVSVMQAMTRGGRGGSESQVVENVASVGLTNCSVLTKTNYNGSVDEDQAGCMTALGGDQSQQCRLLGGLHGDGCHLWSGPA
jgi:hypothetical protein